MKEVQGIFTLYDRKGELYQKPSYFNTPMEFMRAVTIELGRESPLSQFPEDFALVQLGTFNCVTGEIVSDVKQLCGVADLLGDSSDIKAVS